MSNNEHIHNVAELVAGHTISEATLAAVIAVQTATVTVCRLVRACKTPEELRSLLDTLSPEKDGATE